MFPEDHEPDRRDCVSQSVGRRQSTGPVSVSTHCSTWVGDHIVSTTCSSTTSGESRTHGLLEDAFVSCMAGRGHFHFGSRYNLAQPSFSEPWSCRDAPGISCGALARAHEIRAKQRRGENLSGEDRQFLYDEEIRRIREAQRALGMID
jgi:hypothetical protein